MCYVSDEEGFEVEIVLERYCLVLHDHTREQSDSGDEVGADHEVPADEGGAVRSTALRLETSRDKREDEECD